MTVWVRPQSVSEVYEYFNLTGPSGATLKLTLNCEDSRWELVGSDGNMLSAQITEPLTNLVDAAMLVAVVQTATTRRLMIGRADDDSMISAEGDFAPLGVFNHLRLG